MTPFLFHAQPQWHIKLQPCANCYPGKVFTRAWSICLLALGTGRTPVATPRNGRKQDVPHIVPLKVEQVWPPLLNYTPVQASEMALSVLSLLGTYKLQLARTGLIVFMFDMGRGKNSSLCIRLSDRQYPGIWCFFFNKTGYDAFAYSNKVPIDQWSANTFSCRHRRV